MRSPLELSVVVPAFNEERRLGRTLADIVAYLTSRRLAYELIVVDDGSRDGTSALVRELAAVHAEIRLIRLPENCGKGYAVRTGVVNTRGARVLFADADGATPIAEVERLKAALAAADIAIGSRALAGSEVRVEARWYRRIIGRVFHALVTGLTVSGFRDTQCGFKLFDGAVAHDLFSSMRMGGFSFDVELLMMARRRGYRVAEVAVNWVHQPGSQVRIVRDSLRMGRDLFIIRKNALRGYYDQPRVTPLGAVRATGTIDRPRPVTTA